ncbi:hypothetical protein Tco_1083478, partial [Tanacetum coccineum]
DGMRKTAILSARKGLEKLLDKKEAVRTDEEAVKEAFETETECQSLMETKGDISVSLFRHKPTRCRLRGMRGVFFFSNSLRNVIYSDLGSTITGIRGFCSLILFSKDYPPEEAIRYFQKKVEDVAVRLLEWVKVAISYLGFRVAKVLVQLQNKVASYALLRVLKVAEALGSIANEPTIVK